MENPRQPSGTRQLQGGKTTYPGAGSSPGTPVGRHETPNQPAQGVQSLLVNGELVAAEGRLVPDAGPGRPIRRQSKWPRSPRT